MAYLSYLERQRLEQLFQMGGGYVLNFSNRTLQEFIADCTGRDIYGASYAQGSGSKANRVRAFWAKEPNHVVGKLIKALLEYCGDDPVTQPDQQRLYEHCTRIAERLLAGSPVEQLAEITADVTGRDFEVLAQAVKDSIEKNAPEAGLDRLHTFVVKYLRLVCEKRGITTDRDKPLHSLMGEYIKKLREAKLVESAMTERILKSSISTLEAFNTVRNDQSLAHDNQILNYNESLLIFNHVAAAVAFIKSLEQRADDNARTQAAAASDFDDDIPF